MSTAPVGTFRELLRGYRSALGLSQEALAERTGLSVRGISDLERGINRTPPNRGLHRGEPAGEIPAQLGRGSGFAAAGHRAYRWPPRGRVVTQTASAATLAAGAMLCWAIVWAGQASADDREGTLAALAAVG